MGSKADENDRLRNIAWQKSNLHCDSD